MGTTGTLVDMFASGMLELKNEKKIDNTLGRERVRWRMAVVDRIDYTQTETHTNGAHHTEI